MEHSEYAAGNFDFEMIEEKNQSKSYENDEVNHVEELKKRLNELLGEHYSTSTPKKSKLKPRVETHDGYVNENDLFAQIDEW